MAGSESPRSEALADLYSSLMTVTNLSKGPLRKTVYVIIKICVSYSSRKFSALLELLTRRSQQNKTITSSLDGDCVIPQGQ